MNEDEIHAANEELSRAYALCFGSPAGQAVLRDLIGFCRVRTSTIKPGEKWPGEVLEGRRQVYLRIDTFMNLTADEVAALSRGASINRQGAQE